MFRKVVSAASSVCQVQVVVVSVTGVEIVVAGN